MRRTAELFMPGLRRGTPRPSPGDAGAHLLVIAPRHTSSVYVVNDRVDALGTSPECRRLVGLTVAALQAYAAARGWRVVTAPPRREVAP